MICYPGLAGGILISKEFHLLPPEDLYNLSQHYFRPPRSPPFYAASVVNRRLLFLPSYAIITTERG